MLRYYLNGEDYVRRGPPHVMLRVLIAPVFVLSTLVLFGTGVTLLLLGQTNGSVVGLHKASSSFGSAPQAYMSRRTRLRGDPQRLVRNIRNGTQRFRPTLGAGGPRFESGRPDGFITGRRRPRRLSHERRDLYASLSFEFGELDLLAAGLRGAVVAGPLPPSGSDGGRPRLRPAARRSAAVAIVAYRCRVRR